MTKAQTVQSESTPDTVAANAAMSESIQNNPQFEMTDDIKNMIASQVADGIASALPAVMAEMMRSVSGMQSPAFASGASPVVNVSIAPTTDVKPKYLKHYRLDDTVSGKFQMVDVKKMRDNDLSIGEAIIKGRWIHFASDHYYANDQKEVDYIEWLISQGEKIYEDNSSATTFMRCSVSGCGKVFGDEDTLKSHLLATHGVTSPNA